MTIPLSVPDDQGTFDIRDVARMLKISSRSVRRLIDEQGIVPPMRVGRLIRWPKGQILAWIHAGCPATGAVGPCCGAQEKLHDN